MERTAVIILLILVSGWRVAFANGDTGSVAPPPGVAASSASGSSAPISPPPGVGSVGDANAIVPSSAEGATASDAVSMTLPGVTLPDNSSPIAPPPGVVSSGHSGSIAPSSGVVSSGNSGSTASPPGVVSSGNSGSIAPPPGVVSSGNSGSISPPPGVVSSGNSGSISPPSGVVSSGHSGSIAPPPGVVSSENAGAIAPPPGVIATESSSTAPPSRVSSAEADVMQFQAWLKKNGQRPTSSTVVIPNNIIALDSYPPETLSASDSLIVRSKPLTYKQSQALMLRSAPPATPPSEEANEAFNAMMQQNMPLTPQQVIKLRQLIDASQRAASIPATVPPRPVSSTIMVNLAPGATPPAIRLAQGYVTSLVFVDSTGAPWPVASYDLGDPKATNVQWDNKGNVILLQASSPYGDSDLVIRLVGLPTPITLELVLGQRVVDYRTDIHVSGLGPNSKDLPTGTGLPNSANQLLLNVLDGVAPSGSRQLTVTGGDCMAWLLGDRMFLRTRLTVLSPGWVGRMVSPDGMFAYEIQKSSSVLVSQYGEPIELKVEGF